MILWFIIILVSSFVLAARSMTDFEIPKEIKYLLDSKRIKGSIIFFKGKAKHYSSDSSRSSVP